MNKTNVVNNFLISSMKRAKERVSPYQFSTISIETTTYCNRSCHYCPNSTDLARPAQKMDEQLFREIIDSLARHNYKGIINPHFYGEPLTDDRICTFVTYIRNKLPQATIKLFTNGDLLTVDNYLELKKAGVNVFRISNHSPIISAKLVQTLSQIMQHHTHLYSVELFDYYHLVKVKDQRIYNRGGLLDIPTTAKAGCEFVQEVNVDYAGNVVLCCHDYLSAVTLGNCAQSDVVDLWNSKEYKKVRKEILAGNWIFDLCRKCQSGSDS